MHAFLWRNEFFKGHTILSMFVCASFHACSCYVQTLTRRFGLWFIDWKSWQAILWTNQLCKHPLYPILSLCINKIYSPHIICSRWPHMYFLMIKMTLVFREYFRLRMGCRLFNLIQFSPKYQSECVVFYRWQQCTILTAALMLLFLHNHTMRTFFPIQYCCTLKNILYAFPLKL